ncbi:MAG TPA: hypothetical protein VGE90_09730 [Chitinophaga sp.]
MNSRAITLLVLLLCCLTLQLQAKTKFVRIFNLHGHLIARGDLLATTDTSVIIQEHKKQVEVPVTQIGFIKTARAFGGPIAISAGVGFFIGTIIGAAAGGGGGNSNSDLFYEFDESVAVAGGMALGTAGGAVIGTIISAAQKRLRIEVNGDVNTWQQKKQLLNTVLPANG